MTEVTTVGDKVKLKKDNVVGTVHFIGEIKGKQGIFYGIELDDKYKRKGDNDGSVGKISYFKCKAKAGLFVKKAEIIKTNSKHNKKVLRVTVGSQIQCVKPKCKGTIKFIGIPYPFKKAGIYYGIELEKGKGTNNGTVKGRYYFKCKNKHGIFVQAESLSSITHAKKVNSKKKKAEKKTADKKKEISNSIPHPQKSTPEMKDNEKSIINMMENGLQSLKKLLVAKDAQIEILSQSQTVNGHNTADKIEIKRLKELLKMKENKIIELERKNKELMQKMDSIQVVIPAENDVVGNKVPEFGANDKKEQDISIHTTDIKEENKIEIDMNNVEENGILNVSSLRSVLDKKITDSEKCNTCRELFIDKIPVNFDKTLEMLLDETNQEIIDKIYKIFDLCRQTFVFQHQAFNYYTLKTPAYDNTLFKFVDDTALNLSLLNMVYCFGVGKFGRLGLGPNYKDLGDKCPIPTAICATFVEITCYNAHCLGIDPKGAVYGWGYNQKGELGLGDERMDMIYTPELLSCMRKYKALHVAVGSSHSLILTQDGNVWSCGSNWNGALGHGGSRQDNCHVPKLIVALKEEYIVHISCGESHNCAISKEHKLFTWGDNQAGKCGLPNFRRRQIVIPRQCSVDGLPLFTACGSSHTMILTTDHKVYSCGLGDYGALGHANVRGLTNTVKTPKIIDALKMKRVIGIAAGARHSLCVTENGELYTWGSGAGGCLGHGDSELRITPKLVKYFTDKNIRIRTCKGTEKASAAITVNDELYVWGEGTDNWLSKGILDSKNAHIPTKIEYLDNVAVKSVCLAQRHATVITKLKENKNDEFEEKDNILQGDKEIMIKVENEGSLKSKSFQIFAQNKMLFGDMQWALIKKKEYLPFPVYTSSFIDNLQIINQDTIKLLRCYQIDAVYHSKISTAKYLILINENKLEIKKEDIYNNINEYTAQLYDFIDTDLENIEFKIPSNKTKKTLSVSIYVQAEKDDNFYLLKQLDTNNQTLLDIPTISLLPVKQRNELENGYQVKLKWKTSNKSFKEFGHMIKFKKSDHKSDEKSADNEWIVAKYSQMSYTAEWDNENQKTVDTNIDDVLEYNVEYSYLVESKTKDPITMSISSNVMSFKVVGVEIALESHSQRSDITSSAQNLLKDNGGGYSEKNTYSSALNKDFKENENDWIIFKYQDGDCLYFPTRFAIQNDCTFRTVDWGVKTMKLSIGDGNNEWITFDPNPIIVECGDDLQFIEIKGVDCKQIKDFKHIKVEFITNHGSTKSDYQRFCITRFRLYGVIL